MQESTIEESKQVRMNSWNIHEWTDGQTDGAVDIVEYII